jgi:hypothetical protein
MVRLVFRPYTQIRRTICTLVSLRASTRVSPGFALFRHRSPSFGSQQICSYSNLSQVPDRSIVPPGPTDQGSYLSSTRLPLLSLRIRVFHPNTRIYVRLLGPCFKTGQWKPFRQDPEHACDGPGPVRRFSPRTALLSKEDGTVGTGRPAPPEGKARIKRFLSRAHRMSAGL